jgi:excisionase family DNA binding protein
MVRIYMSFDTNQFKIMTVKDIANFLQMKESWVRQRVHKDEIPYYKIGNLVRFNFKDITSWLDTKKEVR